MVGLSSKLSPCKHVNTWQCLTVHIRPGTLFLLGRVVSKESGVPWAGGVSGNWSWMTKSAYWRKIPPLRAGHISSFYTPSFRFRKPLVLDFIILLLVFILKFNLAL